MIYFGITILLLFSFLDGRQMTEIHQDVKSLQKQVAELQEKQK